MASSVFTPRFLIISLGNPGTQYANTFHNAGHIVLNSIQSILSSDPDHNQPSWTTERIGKKSCLQSISASYHIVQSPTFMNTCGQWAGQTYREQLQGNGLSPADLSFVLVHDELEQELGVVRLVPWSRSPRGHNGVKSCHESMGKAGGNRWHRICVGIGRPESREPDAVSNYVLGNMGRHKRQMLEEQAAPGVLEALKQLEKQWEKEVRSQAKQEAKQVKL